MTVVDLAALTYELIGERVSILVLVDDGRRRRRPPARAPGKCGVSILVLVDDGRRQRAASRRNRRRTGFNPCSCG